MPAGEEPPMNPQSPIQLSRAQAEQFQRVPVRFRHGFAGDPAFQEPALRALLERHPEALTDININEISNDGRATVRTGGRGGLVGAAILEAVKSGRVWVNLRKIDAHDPAIAGLMTGALAALQAARPDFRPIKPQGQLLLSGPQARVPYHADQPGVVLFHLVGHKRIWVYPNRAPWLEDRAMEAVALGQSTEDLPYRPAFDDDAQVFDLAPGDGVSWPIHAPHRVDNLGTFNVSLSVEFMTWEARLRQGSYFTNGALRRRFGIDPKPVAALGPVGQAWRWAAAAVLRKAGVTPAPRQHHKVVFTLDRTPA
jgi:hypothetical protein